MDAIINAVQAKKDYSAIADRVCKEEKKNIESAYKNIYDSYNDKYKTVSNLKFPNSQLLSRIHLSEWIQMMDAR